MTDTQQKQTFEGRTLDEATERAKQALGEGGVVAHRVVEEGKAGLFGVGAKRWLIEAWLEQRPAPAAPPAPAVAPPPAPVAPAAAAPPAPGAEAAPSLIAPVRPERRPARPRREPERDGDGDEDGRGRGGALEPPTPETIELARQTIEEIVRLCGFAPEVIARDEADEGIGIEVGLGGEGEGALIGKAGQTLDALQFIGERIVSKKTGSRVRLLIDVAGYRSRRKEQLEQLARRLAEKALATGKTMAFDPMSARDRRIIHLSLNGMRGVSTRSEGEGAFRRLFIVPERMR